jgi:hypothetical protein
MFCATATARQVDQKRHSGLTTDQIGGGEFCLHPALPPTVYEIAIWHTFWLDGSKDARNDCIRYICCEYHTGKEQMTISFLQVVGDLALLLVPCLVMLVWVLKRDR